MGRILLKRVDHESVEGVEEGVEGEGEPTRRRKPTTVKGGEDRGRSLFGREHTDLDVPREAKIDEVPMEKRVDGGAENRGMVRMTVDEALSDTSGRSLKVDSLLDR